MLDERLNFKLLGIQVCVEGHIPSSQHQLILKSILHISIGTTGNERLVNEQSGNERPRGKNGRETNDMTVTGGTTTWRRATSDCYYVIAYIIINSILI